MSRSFRSTKSPGTDWWSRRPLSGISASSNKSGTMKWLKRRVHKIERSWSKHSSRFYDRNDP